MSFSEIVNTGGVAVGRRSQVQFCTNLRCLVRCTSRGDNRTVGVEGRLEVPGSCNWADEVVHRRQEKKVKEESGSSCAVFILNRVHLLC